LCLVGVSTIAELVVSSASPFNIAEELQLPYFTETEVHSLIEQYVTESGQVFEESSHQTHLREYPWTAWLGMCVMFISG
jgi:hypothetical protein